MGAASPLIDYPQTRAVTMDQLLREHVRNIHSEDRVVQGKAFCSVIESTNGPVDWAYEVWDDMVSTLRHKDNHQRAIAAQVLCNLAKSDPENRMLKDFDALLAVTKDERFVTARLCMKSLRKVGPAETKHQQKVEKGLTGRSKACISDKMYHLIRY